jgi:ABC-type lipoprotein release transport system permease subunit
MLLHPLRSVATVACVVAGLLPYLVGLGLSHGVQQQARDSIRWGADLYVSGRRFGRTAPLPLQTAEQIQKIPGVLDIRPRIVGAITLGKERRSAVVVGLPASALPKSTRCVAGRLFRAENELVIGTTLARELKLQPGSLLPPFYQNVEGERVTRVVGVFESDAPLWQADLIFTSLETAATIFDQRGTATELLVDCGPGYQQHVARAIGRLIIQRTDDTSNPLQLRVVTRQQLRSMLPRGLLHREGIFNLHFLLVFSVGILATMATSGFGSAERRREIGVLKATGWRTDEVLLRGTVEAFLLSILGASLSILAAFVWLEWFNGYWLASLFLPGIEATSSADVPFRLLPLPALLGFLIALAIVMSGTLYSSWRAATVPPIEALR